MEVALRHVVLSLLDPLEVAREKDAFALTAGLRLYYKCFRFAIVELVLKLLDVLGQQPRFREKVEVLREVFLH